MLDLDNMMLDNFFKMMLCANVQAMGILNCDLKKIEMWKNLNSF